MYKSRMIISFEGSSWSYGGWVYNYLCNPAQGEVYSIQVCHTVIKFVRDLRQVGGFLRVIRFPLPIKLTATI